MNLDLSPSLLNPRFVVLLAAMAVARPLLSRIGPARFGAIASLILIGVGSPQTLVLIGGTMLLVVYPLGVLISRSRHGTTPPTGGRFELVLGVLLLVGLWLFYKIARQQADTGPAPDGSSIAGRLVAALGFSYFIFRGINYLYMHYLIPIPEAGPSRALYYALFPSTVTSGPIQKYTDFCRELDAPRPFSPANIGTGIYRITQGYFYKICIAAALHRASDHFLVPHPHAYQSLMTVVLLYTFFFFDFAGYSHIAIGYGLLLGIKVPENFKQPFLATSVTEFWRNWHVSLADWFRDHIFIPAGGMRLGGFRAAALAGGILILCGLWHGFTLAFLMWGIWHGSMIFIEGVTGMKPLPPMQRRGVRYLWRLLFTNSRVAFASLFFLPWKQAVDVLEGFLRWA